jgi:PAS domain S-box-containing protein
MNFLDAEDTRTRHRKVAASAGGLPRLEWLLDHMGEAFCQLDAALRVRQVNAAAATLMQRPATALIGRRLWAACKFMRQQAVHTALTEAVAGSRSFAVQVQDAPRLRWFEVRGFPLDAGVALFLRDITAQRCSEALKRTAAESTQRFRCLFDLNPAAVLALDLDGHIVEANPAVQTQFGHEPALLRGQPLTLLLPAWDGTSLLRELSQTRALHDVTARHADGGRRELSVKLLPSVVDGEHHGYFLIARDVTQLRRRLRQLKVQAEVIAHSPEAIAVLDDSGTVVSWNDSAARLFGRPAQAMVGQSFEQLFDIPDRSRLQRAQFQAECGALAPVVLELPLASSSGDKAWLRLSLARMPGVEPGRELVAVYGQDITPCGCGRNGGQLMDRLAA